MLPLRKVLNLTETDAKSRAEIELERFGLTDRLKSFSHQLSGGLKQRVVQARTFAMQPAFLYLDEPTSALDPEWTEYFGKIVREYADIGNMILIVSHQMNFLKKISDEVIYLKNGVILEKGSPAEIFNNPKDRSLIRFIENS
jgi:polar amino acid transport system ATP-binding protein